MGILILFLLCVGGGGWLMVRQIRKILRKHRLELENAEFQNRKNREAEAAAREW
jgi:hypothetical protein